MTKRTAAVGQNGCDHLTTALRIHEVEHWRSLCKQVLPRQPPRSGCTFIQNVIRYRSARYLIRLRRKAWTGFKPADWSVQVTGMFTLWMTWHTPEVLDANVNPFPKERNSLALYTEETAISWNVFVKVMIEKKLWLSRHRYFMSETTNIVYATFINRYTTNPITLAGFVKHLSAFKLSWRGTSIIVNLQIRSNGMARPLTSCLFNNLNFEGTSFYTVQFCNLKIIFFCFPANSTGTAGIPAVRANKKMPIHRH